MTDTFHGRFPRTRARRMRRDHFSRQLMRETRLGVEDLIYPIFVVDGRKRREPVASHARHRAHEHRRAVRRSRAGRALGVPAIALFPVTTADRKATTDARPAIRRASRSGRCAR
jgi:porphobilinogen synthase